jgi:DNA repair protein SbcC/Rad50
MWITRLVLNNFQKHSNLTLNFTDGVNYIYGASDVGKSCIRRALGFLFFGDPRTDDIRKEGTKQTSVSALLDNGIEVERVKSASINRYIIRKNGEEVVYDSIGATIPEDVAKVLQVRTIDIDKENLNLNIAEQISLPFLTEKSGSFRLKLFNHLTGNDLIDTVLQAMNKEILGIGRDIKVEQEFITNNEPKLQEVTIQHEEKAKKLGNFKEKRELLLTKIETYKKLLELQINVRQNLSDIDDTQTRLGYIKIVPEETITNLHTLIDKWVILDDLYGALKENKSSIEQILKESRELKLPELDLKVIKDQINRLEALNKVNYSLQEALGATNRVKNDITGVEIGIQGLEAKYKEIEGLALANGYCPKCQTKLTTDHLKRSNHESN